MTRSVVVTGLGALTPLGPSVDTSWEGVLDGESAAGPIGRFDPAVANLRSRIACETRFDPADHEAVDTRRMGRYAQYAVVAASQALADAGLPVDPETASEGEAVDGETWPADRVGTSIGTGFAGLAEIERAAGEGSADVTSAGEGPTDGPSAGERPSTYFVPSVLANLAAGHVSIRHDARGPTLAPSAACAAGTQAIGTAADAIRAGRADVMLAGGTEAAICPLGVGGFDAMRALSTRNDEPRAASRPFDADRDGFVLGDGGAVLVLESGRHARERGAAPYARVSGYGVTADATHVTRPPSDANGMIRCLRGAIGDADREPAAVDYVNPHGTGTTRGDAHEARALNAVFDSCPPVSSTKSHIGHALGAAGAIESVFTVRALATGTVPPAINYETPDPDCDLPVATAPREADLRVAISASAGFGGVNAALAFETP